MATHDQISNKHSIRGHGKIRPKETHHHMSPSDIGYEREAHLDGLRGICALIVVIHHFFILKGIPDWIKYTPIQLLNLGHLSVILFFILSGYVLSKRILYGLRKQTFSIPIWMAQRSVRLYIPYLAAFLLSTFFYISYGENGRIGLPEGFSSWGAWWWSASDWQTNNWQVWWQFFTLWSSPSDNSWVPTAWSLQHEIRFSWLIPLLIVPIWFFWTSFFGRRWNWKVHAGSIVHLTALGLILYTFWIQTPWIGVEGLKTLLYLPAFVVGILFAVYNNKIRSWIQPIPNAVWWILSITIAFFVFRMHNYGYIENKLVLWNEVIAAALFFLVHFVWDRSFLDRSFARVLGQYSYSLYLIHVPIMMISIKWAQTWVDPNIVFGYLFLLIPIGTYVFYHLVERPTISIARSFGKSRKAA